MFASGFRMLALSFRQGAQTQSVKLDEAGGIAMIIGDSPFLEGHQFLIVKRIGALSANHRHIAFVELYPNPSRDFFLALVDQTLQQFAFRSEPEAVVDELGIFGHELILEMSGAPVEGDRLDATMAEIKDRASGGFIHAPRFHA